MNVQINEFIGKVLIKDPNVSIDLFAHVGFHHVTGLYQEELRELVEELKNAGIEDKHREKIGIIQTCFSANLHALNASLKINPTETARREAQIQLASIAKAVSLMPTLHALLLQKKAEDLFRANNN